MNEDLLSMIVELQREQTESLKSIAESLAVIASNARQCFCGHSDRIHINNKCMAPQCVCTTWLAPQTATASLLKSLLRHHIDLKGVIATIGGLMPEQLQQETSADGEGEAPTPLIHKPSSH